MIALIESCELKDNAICEAECLTDTERKADDEQCAPGADLLPKPKWENKPQTSSEEFKYDVQSWLQMSSLNNLNTSNATRNVNFKKTPSKMAVKPNTDSPGKEFCLKFADYNFIMKTNSNSNINIDGKITVDAFFKSFKDAKTTAASQSLLDRITRSSNTSRDYAYF